MIDGFLNLLEDTPSDIGLYEIDYNGLSGLVEGDQDAPSGATTSAYAAVGVVPRATPSVVTAATTIAPIGIFTRANPIFANMTTSGALAEVGVAASASSITPNMTLFIAGAKIGIAPSAAAVQGFFVSALAAIGIAPRSTATTNVTMSALAEVGVVPRSDPLLGITKSVVMKAGIVPTATVVPSITPIAKAMIGVTGYRFIPPIVGSAAIVLKRMIALGYGSIPISQALVNRRKRRGGLEPPTRPAERHDFFDVRRGQTEAWFAPTLLNSWVIYDGSHAQPGYRKEGDKVLLRGLVKNGTVGIGTPIFTLPEYYRPSLQMIFAVLSNDALGQVRVNPNGDVSAVLPSVNTWVSLDTIEFSVTA